MTMIIATLLCRNKDGLPTCVIAKGYDQSTSHAEWAWASRDDFFGQGYGKGKIVEDVYISSYTATVHWVAKTRIPTEESEILERAFPEGAAQPKDDMYCRFGKYLKELLGIYKNTGKVSGISQLARKYHCAAVTTQQFYELKINQMQVEDLTDDTVKDIRDLIGLAKQN